MPHPLSLLNRWNGESCTYHPCGKDCRCLGPVYQLSLDPCGEAQPELPGQVSDIPY